MSSIPKTQKAWIIVRKGDPSAALSLKEDYPVPTDLGSNDVLVKIEAAALNPVCVLQYVEKKQAG